MGTFVVLVGILAPKLLNPTNEAKTDSAAASGSNTADGSTEQAAQQSAATATDVLRPIEQIVIGVSIAITIGLGVTWLINRQRTSAAVRGPALLNVSAALPLRQNCWAYLIEVGGNQFLAGVDPTGVRSVLALPTQQQEQVDEPRGPAQPILMPTIFPPRVVGGRR